MLIRRATVLDHSWIVDLAANVYGDLGDYRSILPSWLNHSGVVGYVDEDAAGEPQGFTLLGFYEPLGTGELVADLLAIAVEPSRQRRGRGRALLRHAIGTVEAANRENPVSELQLTVAATNVRGLELFRGQGFRILDASHGSYDGGQRAIRMTRSIGRDVAEIHSGPTVAVRR